MMGVVASAPVALRALLADAPRSLSALSLEHRDGWGLAVHDEREWTIVKSARCAAECDAFQRAAASRARVAIAHVRKRTVGSTSLANTHPFQRGRWVLAHNGTVEDLAFLTKRCSQARLDEIQGETDSERLFAFLATAIDEAPSPQEGIVRAARELASSPGVGAVNFLLSDGRDLYAYRRGRTLFVLDRTRDPGRRTPSLAVASEPLTDEPWQEIAQGTLMVLATGSVPTLDVLAAA